MMIYDMMIISLPTTLLKLTILPKGQWERNHIAETMGFTAHRGSRRIHARHTPGS